MGNIITHDVIENITGKCVEEFETIRKIKLKRDLTLNNL